VREYYSLEEVALITWKPIIDGDDLLIGTFDQPVTASWFGGPMDSYDDGQTASGIDNTKMGTRGCSIPMHTDANGSAVPKCADSPIGPVPWKTMVIVNSITRGSGGIPVGTQTTVPMIDVGPATQPVSGVYLNRPIDLCPQTFLDLQGNLKQGLLHVFFRVLGGAKYMKA
jgi:hypothetical protein